MKTIRFLFAAWVASMGAQAASNAGLPLPAAAFAWSPEGRQIAYCGPRFSDRSQVWIVDALIGTRKAVASLDQTPCRAVWHPSSGSLMVTTDREISLLELPSGRLRLVVTSKVAIDAPQISPDGNWISYVTSGKLLIRPFKGGASRMIGRNAGPDWMYRHKLGMEAGYWWAPDSSAIAFLETIPLKDGKLFPIAGDAFPRVSITIADLKTGARRTVRLPQGDAYLPQICWTPDSRALGIQHLDRRQTTLQLLLADAATGQTRAILSETDPYWINANPRGVVFLPDGKRFLWISQRSGFNHIYLYEMSGQLVRPVTEGNWEVTSIDAVDGDSVNFTSTQQASIERQVYRASLDRAGVPARLTSKPGWHAVSYSPDGNSFLDLYTSSTQLPSVALVHASGREIPLSTLEAQLPTVEFSTAMTHDGVAMNTMLIRPPDFDPTRKYPAVILAPTGPRTQIVRNACDTPDLLWARDMARHGFVVFAADGRGSGGRGKRFEEPLHYRLGGMELPDQLDALAYLRRLGYVDMKRLGVFGSEYGGMLAIGAMMHAHGVYRSGFADSPITDWTAVDVFTAERYLGSYAKARVPYDESSPNEFAKRLEDRLYVTADPGESQVHVKALRAELDESHKLRGDRATIELGSRASLFDRATRFFVETLLPTLN